jgi:N-acetylglucosaminyldiphosphoundecaprenol N-acetyl-beta-D-mannosaminyltransferase
MSLPVLDMSRSASQSQGSPRAIFGFRPSSDNIDQLVNTILTARRAAEDGVGLVVTPNIDHVAQLRRNPALRHAYADADKILCDGFPVHYYALARGLTVNRVTGCELVERLLANSELIYRHRLFFVVDSERTARAVYQWADRDRLRTQVVTRVPPFGFDADGIYSAKLADEIRSHATTLLVMAVGAPRSEIFVYQYRTLLPPCWAICVGQGVKVLFGIIQRAPILVQRLHAEWLWRVAQEPRRLLPRYIGATIGFGAGVFWDLWKPASCEPPPEDTHKRPQLGT